MKLFNVVIAFLVAVLLSVLIAHRLLHVFWYSDMLAIETSTEEYAVSRGASVSAVVDDLVEKDILQNSFWVKLSLRYFQPGLVLKAGEYQLPPRASRSDLFALLASGISLQYQVTLIEGQTAHEVYRQLKKNTQLDRSENMLINNENISSLLELLTDEAIKMMRGQQHPEGWFFPDTYFFSKGDTGREVLLRAHQKMLDTLQREWQQRQAGLPYQDMYDALIMASLIEKETGAVEEREEIAGVFVRRLKLRMRLQTDPSVIYGLGDEYKGNLRRKHLRRDTPYNTYTRHGLPPTPIALPGLGAIRAALNPAPGETLYFVAKGDGRHHFSKTLEEHQAAVRQYQVLNRRSDYRSAPRPGAG